VAIAVSDVETIAGARDVAAQVNELGRFDTLIHNAAVGYREGHRVTADGLPHVFAINTHREACSPRKPQAARLSELRHAPSCRRQSRRHSLEEAPLERFDRMMPNPQADDQALQDRLMATCKETSLVSAPDIA
jgi:NAD(P)-dependent dehydrogenase (short-subunit alcohol dehydrogenase family)